MSFFDELKKLTRPYDVDDEGFLDEAEPLDPPVQEKPRGANPFARSAPESSPVAAPAPVAASRSAVRPREGRVVNLGAATGQTQVVLLKPERFETAAEVADHLRSRRAVLVNLESTSKDVARRLVDFLSGVTYAIDGNIRKVASNTYILTPPNVNLVGDLMDELETSGVYF